MNFEYLGVKIISSKEKGSKTANAQYLIFIILYLCSQLAKLTKLNLVTCMYITQPLLHLKTLFLFFFFFGVETFNAFYAHV